MNNKETSGRSTSLHLPLIHRSILTYSIRFFFVPSNAMVITMSINTILESIPHLNMDVTPKILQYLAT